MDGRFATAAPEARGIINLKCAQNFGHYPATCPNTEKMFYPSYTHLPLYPLTQEQLEYQAYAVVEAVREMKQGK